MSDLRTSASNWHDYRGKQLAQVPADAVGLPYSEWRTWQASRAFQEAAQKRRMGPETRHEPPDATANGKQARKPSVKADRLLETDSHEKAIQGF